LEKVEKKVVTELRWIKRQVTYWAGGPETVTEKVLQYRVLGRTFDRETTWSKWVDVPTVVEGEEEEDDGRWR
jgi:hypothetical protein